MALPPGTPGNLRAGPSPTARGLYAVAWDAAAGAAEYRLQSHTGDGTWTGAYTGPGLSAAFAPGAGEAFAFRVRACNRLGCGGWSPTLAYAVPGRAPATPEPFSVPNMTMTGYYEIRWGASADAGWYVLEEGVDGAWSEVDLARTTATSAAFEKTAKGTFQYRLKACNLAGCSAWTATGTVLVWGVATASAPPAPAALAGLDASADGSYTLKWGPSEGATRYELQERVDGGAWSLVPTAGASTSVAFAGRPDGGYEYRVRACDGSGCGAWTAVKAVRVAVPPAAGFHGDYVARTGDLGADGDADIYLSPAAAGTGNVGEFILRNDAGAIVMDTAPGLAELAVVRAWPASPTLSVTVQDANMDGVRDVYVGGVAGALPGAVDQIVVGSAEPRGAPAGLVAVDEGLRTFFGSVMAWYEDPGHFHRSHPAGSEILFGGAETASEAQALLDACDARAGPGACYQVHRPLADRHGGHGRCPAAAHPRGVDGPAACDGRPWHVFIRAAGALEWPDYAGLPAEVPRFIGIWESGGGAREAGALAGVLEGVLGVAIGGRGFAGAAGDGLDDAGTRRFFEAHQTLLDVWALLEGRAGGSTDRVRVTKRRAAGGSASGAGGTAAGSEEPVWRTALEYGGRTIGAHPAGGKLLSRKDHIGDRNNVWAGTVGAATLAGPEAVWAALVEAERAYSDALDRGVPAGGGGPGRCGSDGFALGLVQSIGGSTTAPIGGDLPGNRPVPSSEFMNPGCG